MRRRLKTLEAAEEQQEERRVRFPTPPRVYIMLRDRLDAGHYQHLSESLKRRIREAAAAAERDNP